MLTILFLIFGVSSLMCFESPCDHASFDLDFLVCDEKDSSLPASFHRTSSVVYLLFSSSANRIIS